MLHAVSPKKGERPVKKEMTQKPAWPSPDIISHHRIHIDCTSSAERQPLSHLPHHFHTHSLLHLLSEKKSDSRLQPTHRTVKVWDEVCLRIAGTCWELGHTPLWSALSFLLQQLDLQAQLFLFT
ncbi:hypothetical protein AOLI_G00294290 [Acnodon oligacanthus]